MANDANIPASDRESIDRKLDQFHWHEALDRTALLQETFDAQLLSHPVIQQTPELLSIANAADEALCLLYQRVGSLDPFWNPQARLSREGGENE